MLRQNTTLAPDTRHKIEEILRQDHTDISFLDSEISKLQSPDLKHRRQIIQTRVDRNKALLAPIRHIPVEILQQIFTLCFPFVSTADMQWLPFQVSHVSAHWRFVASTMPDLWSKIDLNRDVLGVSMCSKEQEHRIINRFVSLAHEQSGKRPITMSIPPALRKTEESQDLKSLVTHIILELCDHWVELSLDVDLLHWLWFQSAVLSPGQAKFRLPVVERLALLDRPRNPTLCFVPRNMTQLTHLKLLNFSTPATRLIIMPWSQITHLEVFHVPINDLRLVLSQMTTLTHAHLAPGGVYEAPGVPSFILPQVICLPYLRDLTISSSQAIICDVAKLMTTPILSQFRVIVSSELDAPQDQMLGQTLRDFIDRSSPPITHLGLQHISAEDMKDILEGLVTIESLDLSIQDDSNALDLIMNQLVWSTQPDGCPELGATNLLPNLHMLTVRRTNLSGVFPCIMQTICSRLNGHITSGEHLLPARLQKICFRSMDSLPSSVQLRQLGVGVDCRHGLCTADLHHLNISTIWPPWLDGSN